MDKDPLGGADRLGGGREGPLVQMPQGLFQAELLLAQIVGGLKGPAHQQRPGQLSGRAVRVVLGEHQIFQLFEVLAAQVPGKAGAGGF